MQVCITHCKLHMSRLSPSAVCAFPQRKHVYSHLHYGNVPYIVGGGAPRVFDSIERRRKYAVMPDNPRVLVMEGMRRYAMQE